MTPSDGPLEGEASLPQHHLPKSGHGMLMLGAAGVVYGDIGTSPIYALRETLRAATNGGTVPPTSTEIIGSLSIIVWALTVIVTLKYALIVLRAGNKGEGGTLSLAILAQSAAGRMRLAVVSLGVIGAALFFGDAVITPAISVLSAVEGFELTVPAVEDYIIPITAGILIALFAVQRYGTGRVSAVFGPVMLIWFACLAAAGAGHVMDDPAILRALNPLEAVAFAQAHTGVALAVAGAAFLAVTGAEALYVDLGHFGRKPIIHTWFVLVFPALVINYLGQGAYLLKTGGSISQPLFEMMPSWGQTPLVVLATVATVIASQAVISGAFSMARQAAQLHLLPRLTVIHTSETQSGQIYLPQVNWLLLAGVLALVLGFGSSDAIAAAYGIAISGQMLVTTLLLALVMRGVWGWPLPTVLLVTLIFAAIDATFLTANMLKFLDGGWVSIFMAAVLLAVMTIWTRGSRKLFEKTRRMEIPLADLAASLEKSPPHRVPGTAIFMTGDQESAPTSLLHSLKHYKVLHQQNLIMTVKTQPVPHVEEDDRVEITPLNGDFKLLTVNFGYMEDPNIPRALKACRKQGIKFDIMSTSFFLSRRTLIPAAAPPLTSLTKRVFIQLARNAADTTSFFRLPTGRVVEIGTQVVI
ncbi:potassium transporter Kup [Pannonibacter indicus]|uniref:potassium transporter Kup n=1 Tax=Pannonibacter indicus TaxID=466044 RepID=UPI0035AEDE66